MTRLIKSLYATALLASVGGVSAAHAAGLVVVRSTGPSAADLHPGKQLPEGGSVTLKSGDILTLLDKSGTRVFRGPGVISLSRSNQTAGVVGSFLRNTGEKKQVRTGAVRGATSLAHSRPADIWMVDTSRSATVCYRRVKPVSLWTPRQDKPGSLQMVRLADGKKVAVPLQAGQSIRAWPTGQLPLSNEAGYQISGSGREAPVVLTFKAVENDPENPAATVAQMIAAGCDAQVDMLVKATEIIIPDEGEENLG